MTVSIHRQHWTVPEAAEILGVPASRVEGWIDKYRIVTCKVIAGTRFLDRKALVRLALLLEMQEILGERSPLATTIARNLPDSVAGVLDRLDLEDDAAPDVVFTVGPDRVTLHRNTLRQLQARIQEVALV
jgi:hypothetical protein